MSKLAVSVTLDEDLIRAIDTLADKADRPRSWFFSEAVRSYLMDLRDADEALDRLHSPTDTTMTLDAVRDALDL